MNPLLLRVAWYRLRATFRHRRGALLSLVLLVGITGGVAMASVAAGRRTQSSYPTFLASTNPSDMTVSVYTPNGGEAVSSLQTDIVRLPGVKRVRTVVTPTFIPLAPNGAPRLTTAGAVSVLGSLDGEFLDQDRLSIVEGHGADPARADQMVMTATAARLLGVRVGQVVPLGYYTRAQESLPDFGTPRVAPTLRVPVKLVGIAVFDNAVVQDDVDSAYGFVMATPALIHRAAALDRAATAPIGYTIQLEPGVSATSVEQRIASLIPPRATSDFHVTARVVAEVELALKPESVALGAFGVIAALVCLVLGMQAVSRQLRVGDEDRQVLRALGAGPVTTAADGLIGVVTAVVLGAVVAVAVAVGLSPLSPLGPVRPVYPDGGVAFDGTVLGLGFAVVVCVLGATALVQSYRLAPQRAARVTSEAVRGSAVARSAESTGMPVAGVMGLRFALEPGRGRTAVPVRSALLGTVIAVALVVATITFATSLRTLVSHPALYGWNWTYALNPSNDVPPSTGKLLDHDPDVAAWTGVDYNDVTIDGQNIPAIMARSLPETLSPPILSGHGLYSDREIVLGAATLAVLHKHVGDTVLVGYQGPQDAPIYIPPTPLRVVGTATFPAVGFESLVADHTSMGTGALFSEGIFPPAFLQAIDSGDPNSVGPELTFVRLKAGVSAGAGRADMRRIAVAADRTLAADPNTQGQIITVLGVQRPAQIVNYRTIGYTPVVLAVGLALGAVVALALSLTSSVRRRRRDLALLKALGFTPRQLTAAVSWQATVAAVVGVVVGVPVGIVVGRELWTLFARSLDAVPDPSVPALSVVLVVVGALVFANLVAALPGRDAARTPTASLLRTE
ncbi:MAG: FtsX-like permease family protein [Acidimicrobiales bacterium]